MTGSHFPFWAKYLKEYLTGRRLTEEFTFWISASCFCCILSVSSWCLASKTL